MEKAKHSIRFQTTVDSNGNVSFSKSVADLLVKQGAPVTVQIVRGILTRRLKTLKITEEEIEQIGKVQFEDRDHVTSFLSSQSILRNKRQFLERVRRMTA